MRYRDADGGKTFRNFRLPNNQNLSVSEIREALPIFPEETIRAFEFDLPDIAKDFDDPDWDENKDHPFSNIVGVHTEKEFTEEIHEEWDVDVSHVVERFKEEPVNTLSDESCMSPRM